MDDESNRQIWKWDGQSLHEAVDELAIEEPLEIRLRGRSVSITMRTPGHDEELALGFLLTEGVIRSAADVMRAVHCDRDEAGNVLNVQLAPEVVVDFERLTRHVFASSSCGVCGKATIESIKRNLPAIQSDLRVSPQLLSQLPALMREAQSTFDRTGGIHAAAIFNGEGQLIVIREDVGRHNAVDKAIGYCLQNGIFPLNQHILMVSGRSSFEIVQKSLSASVPILAAVSAPSTLAVELAANSGQTLIGFLRDQRMNVYCGVERISRE